ncbi:hypothetical protein LI328DRAFT_56546 [Trichoderma asperelloides]|nr:hypothetical protein LI328DRAFT_56546 [Trichoderma asperelloides]
MNLKNLTEREGAHDENSVLQKRKPLASNTRTMCSRPSNMSCSFSPTNQPQNGQCEKCLILQPLFGGVHMCHVPHSHDGCIRRECRISRPLCMHETDVDGALALLLCCTSEDLCVTGERENMEDRG